MGPEKRESHGSTPAEKPHGFFHELREIMEWFRGVSLWGTEVQKTGEIQEVQERLPYNFQLDEVDTKKLIPGDILNIIFKNFGCEFQVMHKPENIENMPGLTFVKCIFCSSQKSQRLVQKEGFISPQILRSGEEFTLINPTSEGDDMFPALTLSREESMKITRNND